MDEQAAQKIVRHAFEAGINFIDSADAYNEGRSEEVTGRAIAGWNFIPNSETKTF